MTGIDMRKFKALKRKVGKEGLRPLYVKWGVRYLAETKRRYKKNAKGGGEWAPLKHPSYERATGSAFFFTRNGKKTSKKRRTYLKSKYATAVKKIKILIDTGTLFGALSPGGKGNLFQILEKGVRVGFSGAKHPKGTDTIRKIAMRHQTGDPSSNLPKRIILHNPSSRLKTQMMRDLSKALKGIINGR
jgi:hypothetical protein